MKCSLCVVACLISMILLFCVVAGAVEKTVTVSAEMQNRQDVQIATSSDDQSVTQTLKTIENLWEDWLSTYNLKEGWNPSGLPRIAIVCGVAVVRARPGERKWVVARNAAFDMAELSAKQKLAEIIKVYLQNGRFSEFASQGGEVAAPMFSKPIKQLSIAEKTRALADKTLDDAIKHFDPAWDGTGMTEEQKHQKLVILQEKLGRHVSARARLFASGSFAVTTFEGPNADGNYSVLVGIIWSMRLAKLAESIFNSEIKIEPVPPKQPIKVQLEEMGKKNPNIYFFANGVRVWTNEKGQRVIVSFASVPATSSIMIDKDRATLIARSRIQSFVAELIETKSTIEGDFTYQETSMGNRTFDSESYYRRIDAKANSLPLSGAEPIGSWRGMHPFGDRKMHVVALSWSPDTGTAAHELGRQLDYQENRMQRQGFGVSSDPDSIQGASEAISAPIIQGPSSDPTEF